VAAATCFMHTRSLMSIFGPASARACGLQESQMPKIKTKSGAKKRFKITATGKVLYAHLGKRHGMIKRTKKQIRQLRGTSVLFKTDGERIKKYFLPNG
jgi:large subunit ribosomal protein L35